MKKILALSAFAILGAVGCASASDNLCIEFQTCAEADDPAAECQEAKDDQDDDAKACSDACSAENNAFAQCYLDNSKCEDKLLTLDPADACNDEAEAVGTCVEDNC